MLWIRNWNFLSNDTWNILYFLISSWCDNITWVSPSLILTFKSRCKYNWVPSFNVNCSQNIYQGDETDWKCRLIFNLLLFLLNGCCGSEVVVWCQQPQPSLIASDLHTFWDILDPAPSCYLNKPAPYDVSQKGSNKISDYPCLSLSLFNYFHADWALRKL